MYVHHTGADFLAHSPAQLVPVKHRPLESDESLEESAHFSFKIHVWFSPGSFNTNTFLLCNVKKETDGEFLKLPHRLQKKQLRKSQGRVCGPQ